MVVIVFLLLLGWVLQRSAAEHRSIGGRRRRGGQVIRLRLWRNHAPRLLWTRRRHEGSDLTWVVALPGLRRALLGVAGGEDPLEHLAGRRRRVAGQALVVALVDDDVG